MKLVVGLGNPGLAYKDTRHNLGFMVVDALAKDFAVRLKPDTRANALMALAKLKAKPCLAGRQASPCGLKGRMDFRKEALVLCKPLSYMNLCGPVVLKLLQENKAHPKDILVICDDINLELGRLKIKAEGSSGGHKGVASIIKSLKTEAFPRLRIGISAPKVKGELESYVLSRFLRGEQKVIQHSIDQAKEAVLCWLDNGIEVTMNRFNHKGD